VALLQVGGDRSRVQGVGGDPIAAQRAVPPMAKRMFAVLDCP
jgi:hypothetical protein